MQSLMAASRLGYGPLAKLSQEIRPNLDLSKRGADLARGPQALSKLPAAAWSNTWPAPAATLDLDFANNRGFVRGSGQGGAMDAVTFTRASSGNWVDNTGVLRTGAGTFAGTANALGNNLISIPQDFTNAYWTKSRTTVTDNSITSPSGVNNASVLVETTATGQHDIYSTNTVIGLVANTQYTFSGYVKPAGRNFVTFDVWNGASTWFAASFNIATGSLVVSGAAGGTFVSSNIFDAGNGWYRISITGTFTTSVGGYVDFILSQTAPSSLVNYGAPNNASYTGDGTSGIYIWGAQLEVGSSATTYYPTNINAPRFDWASTTQLPQNLLTYTEAFNNAAWVKQANGSISATDSAVAPDGTTTADTYLQAATPSLASIRQATTLSAISSVTFSVYVQAITGSIVNLGVADSATVSNGFSAFFNLSTGVVGTTGVFGTGGVFTSAAITSVGSGWYRLSVSGTVGTTASIASYLFISNADNSGTRLANGSCYLWGAQLQTGTSLTAYTANLGAFSPTNTPLVANSTCNGLLIEESRTNRILWCRDATSGTGTNLLPRSQLFSNAAWVKTGLAVTSENNTAPDSTATAALVTLSAGSSNHQILQGPVSIASGILHTSSIYLKAGNWNYYTLDFYSTATAWASISVDLSTGTITRTGNGSGGTYVSSSITNVGSGWYRISLTCSLSATSGSFLLQYASVANPTIPSNNFGIENPWTAAGTETGYLWGAQLEVGQAVTSYTATTTSQLFGWSKSSVTVAKTATGIDGVANAATAITATANNAYCLQPISLASGSRTASVYLKRISGTGNVQVTLDGSTWSTVDLSNGLWNRIVLSGTVTNPCVGVLLATSGDAVAMDYAQVEDGAFATTPILTTTATATRAVDSGTIGVALVNGFYNQNGGTFVAAFQRLNSAAAMGCSITGDNNNTNRSLFIGLAGNGNYQFNSQTGGTTLYNNADVFAGTGLFRAAYSAQQGRYSFSYNGLYRDMWTSAQSSNLNLPTATTLNLNNNPGSNVSGYVRQITYIPRISNGVQLQDATAGNT